MMHNASELKEIASTALTSTKFIVILMGKAKQQAEMGCFSVNVTIPASIGEADASDIRTYLNEKFGYNAKLTTYKGFRMMHISWR